MAAFDALPKSIRDRLNESTCNLNPVQVMAYFGRKGEQATLDHITYSEGRNREDRQMELGY